MTSLDSFDVPNIRISVPVNNCFSRADINTAVDLFAQLAEHWATVGGVIHLWDVKEPTLAGSHAYVKLARSHAYVKLARCHAYVKLSGSHAYVKLSGSHAYVKLARCHAYVKLAGCHVCQLWRLAVLLTPSQKRRKWLLRILNDENHGTLLNTGHQVLTKIKRCTHLSNV